MPTIFYSIQTYQLKESNPFNPNGNVHYIIRIQCSELKEVLRWKGGDNLWYEDSRFEFRDRLPYDLLLNLLDALEALQPFHLLIQVS